MLNNLYSLLSQWFPRKDETQWVLGTVYRTEGPAYRKAGSMMLFSGDGQQLGMLSGGCLESDIQRHARKVMLLQRSVLLSYDGSDEDDISFQLGIGCGGSVYIMLQPVTAENSYLMLDQVLETLEAGRSGNYAQLISTTGEIENSFTPDSSNRFVDSEHQQRQRVAKLHAEGDAQWLLTCLYPTPHLLVIGGGADARPLVSQANSLGWRVSVWDPRPANARAEYFMDAYRLLNCEPEELPAFIAEHHVNATVLMSHNVTIDSAALSAILPLQLNYIALLGPENRRAQVIERSGLDEADVLKVVHGPAGLDIGAQLPETIALSILAECHAVLYGGSCSSMKQRQAPQRGI